MTEVLLVPNPYVPAKNLRAALRTAQIVKRPGEDVLVATGRDAELFYMATVTSMSATNLSVRFGPEFNVRAPNAIKV